MRRTPFTANIIISNLPDNFTSGALASLFDDYGLVLGAVINRSTHGGGALRGMVNLAPPKAVEAAIGALDGMVIEQHHLRVRRAPEPPVRAPRPKAPRRPVISPREAATPSALERAAFAPTPPRPVRAVIVERRPLSRIRLAPKTSAGD